MPQREPDVAFGLHPDLGVVAAIVDDNDYLMQVLDERGFNYYEFLDLYVLPRHLPHSMAVRMVTDVTRKLQDSEWAVAVDPAISLPAVYAPFRPPAAAPTRDALPGGTPEERARVRAATSASPKLPATAPSDPPPPAPPTTAPPRGTGPTR